MAFDTKVDFGVVVGGGVGIVLAGEGKNYAGILFADRGQLITAVAAGDFDAGPLAPQINSRCRFDHFVDVGSADASGTLKKIKMTVCVGVDVFGVRNPAHQAERGNQVAVDGPQGRVIFTSAQDGEGGENSSALGYVHRGLAVFADVGEDDFVFGNDRVDVID